MVDKAGSENQKWLRFVLFGLFFVMFQVQVLTKADNTAVYDILINSEYTEFRGTYSFDNDLPCGFRVTSHSKKEFWDFKLYVNDSLELTEDFLKTYEKDKDNYSTEIPCINVPNSKIRQTYKYTGGTRNLVSGSMYPFDKYEFESNISTVHPLSGWTLHKVKITLPENTFPVPSSRILTFEPKQIPIGAWLIQNGSAGELATPIKVILVIDSQEVSNPLSFFEKRRFSLIYPEKKSLTDHPISIVAQWERPLLVKFLFVASFISILMLSILFAENEETENKFKLQEYLAHSFTIFALQEGINQVVIPAGRPLTVTLFESPMIMALLVSAFYIVKTYLNGWNRKGSRKCA